jgi:hypothetical protein
MYQNIQNLGRQCVIIGLSVLGTVIIVRFGSLVGWVNKPVALKGAVINTNLEGSCARN